MTQQTAVEWLIMQLPVKIRVELYEQNIHEQAKQMEKEQSKQDYDAGLFDGTMDDVKDRLYKNAEQYYNETYGKEMKDLEKHPKGWNMHSQALRDKGYTMLGWRNDDAFVIPEGRKFHSVTYNERCKTLYICPETKEYYMLDSGD